MTYKCFSSQWEMSCNIIEEKAWKLCAFSHILGENINVWRTLCIQMEIRGLEHVVEVV